MSRSRYTQRFTFDTLGDLAARAKQVPFGWSGKGPAVRDLYNLEHDMDESCRRALRGDTTIVAKAEALLDKIAASVECPTHTWHSSPYGAYAVVPEFLAGLPDPMRYRRKQPTETAPINLWVNLATAITIPDGDLLNRGITLLALVLALQRYRSVNLRFIYGCLPEKNNVLITVNIDTTPLELSTVCYALCDRHFMHNMLKGIVRHASESLIGGQVTHAADCRSAWDIPAEDMLITGTIDGDTWNTRTGDLKLMSDDPIAWVNKQIRDYIGESD